MNALAVGPFGIAVGGNLAEPGAQPGDSVALFVVAQVAGTPPLASDVRVYE